MARGATMAKLDLPYVKAYTDRHGVRRHYFRRKGQDSVPLPGRVGSEEFMAAYNDACGSASKPREKKAGTFGRIITDYYRSAQFVNLADNSKALYRTALEPIGKKYGHNAAAATVRNSEARNC